MLAPYVGKQVLVEGYIVDQIRIKVVYFRPLFDEAAEPSE